MPRPVPQAAVLAIRDDQICMVTSRSGKRWVIPKGRIEIRQTPMEAAYVEAWEEAGLLGTIQSQPIGTYTYTKFKQLYSVDVYVLDVTSVRDEWPEKNSRTREWLDIDEAVSRIEEPELQALVMQYAEQYLPQIVM